MKKVIIFSFLISFAAAVCAQQTKTFAERLGWPKGARALK